VGTTSRADPVTGGATTPRRISPARAEKYAAERKALIEAGYRYLGRPSKRGLVLDVLEDTGLSTRAFYRHFAGRDDLVVSMLQQDAGKVNRRLAQAVADSSSAAEGLHAYAREYLLAAYRPRRAVRSRALSSAEAYRSAAVRDVAAADAAEKRASLRAVFETTDGTLEGAHPEEDAYAMTALLMRYSEDRLLGTHDVPFETALEHTVDLFVHAMAWRSAQRR
jgi:AcrR family transcriptional regulator